MILESSSLTVYRECDYLQDKVNSYKFWGDKQLGTDLNEHFNRTPDRERSPELLGKKKPVHNECLILSGSTKNNPVTGNKGISPLLPHSLFQGILK